MKTKHGDDDNSVSVSVSQLYVVPNIPDYWDNTQSSAHMLNTSTALYTNAYKWCMPPAAAPAAAQLHKAEIFDAELIKHSNSMDLL